MRLGAKIGHGCAALHDLLFRDLHTTQLQLDELWAFIGKKQKRVRPGEDATKGDSYTFLGLDALNKAIISYRVSKADGRERTRLSARPARTRARNALHRF